MTSNIIAPSNLLSLNTPPPSTFNPRYLQAYTDRQKQLNAFRLAKSNNPYHNQPPNEEHQDGGTRRLQDFVSSTTKRVDDANVQTLGLLTLKGLKAQSLYREQLEQPRSEEQIIEDMIDEFRDDPEMAALRIQCWYRGIMGKRRHAEIVKEQQRRIRAAVRIQCAWRGRMGYANFVKMRAQKYEEMDGAVRIQGLWRGKSSRDIYNEKKKDLKARNENAAKIQALYRGRQSRLETLRKKRERGNVIATTTKWGETENGLALLVDLSGLNKTAKYAYSSVMSVPSGMTSTATQNLYGDGAGAGAGAGAGGRYLPLRYSKTSYAQGDADENDSEEVDEENERLLDELKGDSSSMVKALARLESMANSLEEDFAKTNDDLLEMKRATDEGLMASSGKAVSSRLGALEFENEIREKQERERRRAVGTEGGRIEAAERVRRKKERERVERQAREIGVREGEDTERQCEEDLKECWSLIEQLQTKLY